MRTEYEQLSTRIKKDESNQTKSLETLIQEVLSQIIIIHQKMYLFSCFHTDYVADMLISSNAITSDSLNTVLCYTFRWIDTSKFHQQQKRN